MKMLVKMLLVFLCAVITGHVTHQATSEDGISELKSKISQMENELEVIKQLLKSIQNFQTLDISNNNNNNNNKETQGSSCSSDVQHVYFFASYTSSVVGAVDPIRYNNIFVNIGDSYKPATGIFTCPVSGIYQFFFGMNFGRGSMTNIWLMHDGKRVIMNHSDLPGNTSLNQQVLLLKVMKGNQVWVMQEAGNSWSTADVHTITFGGILLHAITDA